VRAPLVPLLYLFLDLLECALRSCVVAHVSFHCRRDKPGARAAHVFCLSKNLGMKKIAKEPKSWQIARQKFLSKCFLKEQHF